MRSIVPVAVIAFAVGIVARSTGELSLSFAGALALIAGGMAVYLTVHKRRSILLGALVIACLFCAFGVVRMQLAVPHHAVALPVGEVTLSGVVVSEPDERGTHTNIIFAPDTLSYRVLVRTSAYTDISYHDRLRVEGILLPTEDFLTEEDRVFRYRGYLAKDNIYAVMAFPGTLERETRERTFLGSLFGVKDTYVASLNQLLPEPHAALAAGITVGERRSLGDELTEDFRDTGLIHIVVLSGYNVAVIVIFISFLFARLPDPIRYSLALLSIFLFVLLVGASAPVVRAGIMGGIGVIGMMSKRSYDAAHALFIAGGIMLLINPYLLVYDPSFQLSFVATLGLLFGAPLLEEKLRFIPQVLKLRELAAITIATQIAVLPLLLFLIGELSFVALPVNLLALPAIPLAMLAVFLAGLFGILHTFFALPFSFGAYLLLEYVLRIVDFFAHLPIATTAIPSFPLVFLGVAYALLALMLFLAQRQNVSQSSPS